MEKIAYIKISRFLSAVWKVQQSSKSTEKAAPQVGGSEVNSEKVVVKFVELSLPM